jgi:hypothetical protein
MLLVEIFDVHVQENCVTGYQSRASVKVGDECRPFRFSLLIPFGCYGTIEKSLGRFGDAEVRKLFEARIRQYIASGRLKEIPAGSNIDLPALDYREVRALI